MSSRRSPVHVRLTHAERVTVKLNAVRVEEIDPPAGVKPIVWLLLTTHPVKTLEDALRIVGWYRARWTIEQVFRVMKSQGLDLEVSHIETPRRWPSSPSTC